MSKIQVLFDADSKHLSNDVLLAIAGKLSALGCEASVCVEPGEIHDLKPEPVAEKMVPTSGTVETLAPENK